MLQVRQVIRSASPGIRFPGLIAVSCVPLRCSAIFDIIRADSWHVALQQAPVNGASARGLDLRLLIFRIRLLVRRSLFGPVIGFLTGSPDRSISSSSQLRFAATVRIAADLGMTAFINMVVAVVAQNQLSQKYVLRGSCLKPLDATRCCSDRFPAGMGTFMTIICEPVVFALHRLGSPGPGADAMKFGIGAAVAVRA